MSKLYRASVYLPFTYAQRQEARNAKGSRLAPHEWNEAAIAAQKPEHREFLNRTGCRSKQIDSDDGWVRFDIGGGWIGEETALEFSQVFDGCIGRLEDVTKDAVLLAL